MSKAPKQPNLLNLNPNILGSGFPVFQAPYKSNQPDIPYNSLSNTLLKKTDIINFPVSSSLKPYIVNANHQHGAGLQSRTPRIKKNRKLEKENILFSGKKKEVSAFGTPKGRLKHLERDAEELNRSLKKLKNDLLLNKESLINQFMTKPKDIKS